MVKSRMGGTKRKIPIEWIEDTNRRAVTFSKRRNGIFSKAAELCQLSGAQIAILVSPVSSQSHVSFYSFGHSSVDSVLSAFLNNQRPPREDTVSKFWWEDESLAQSEDPNELRCAMNSISTMLHQVKALRAKKQREGLELVLHGNQTLDIPSTSATSLCLDEDYLEEEEQITAISDDDNNNNDLVVDLETKEELVLRGDQTLDCDNDYLGVDYREASNSEGHEQIMARSDNNNNNNDGLLVDLDRCDQDFSLDQGFDFETNTEGTSINLDMDDVSMATTNQNPYSAFKEDGTLVMVHTDSNEDHLVSISDNNINLNGCNQELDLDQIDSEDYFNDLAPIVAL